MLDEVDSGLDVDAFKAVAWLLKELNTQERSFIIITHYFSILDYLPVDEVIVLESWKLVAQWWYEIAKKVREWWFGSLDS
jgi:Fe-S cluster assembly ATP-binding protein